MGGFSKLLEQMGLATAERAAKQAAERAGPPVGPLVPPEAPKGATGTPQAPVEPIQAPPSPQLDKAAMAKELEDTDLVGMATEHFRTQGAESDPVLREQFGLEPSVAAREPEGLLFNPTRIQSTDDINTLFDQVAEAFPDRFKEYTRGVQKLSDIELRAQASMFDMTAQQVMDMRALKAEEFTKAGFTLINMAEEVKRLGVKLATPEGSDLDAAKLQILMEDFVLTTMHFKGMQTETARTVSAMRIYKKATREANQQVAEIIEQFGGMGMKKRLAAMINSMDVSTPDGMAVLSSFIHKSHRATLPDMLWEAYYAALLSAVPTHVVNTGTASAAYLWRQPEMYGAFAIGQARHALLGKLPFDPNDTGIKGFLGRQAEQGILAKELWAFTVDMDTIVNGLRNGWRGFKSGQPGQSTQRIEGQLRRPAITASNVRGMIDDNVITKYVTQILPSLLKDGHWTQKGFDLTNDYVTRLGFRLMLTGDEMNRGFAFQSAIKAGAARTAVLEGLSGQRYVERVTDLLADPKKTMPDIYKGALDLADELTFMGAFDTGTTGRRFQDFLFNRPTVTNPVAGSLRFAGQAGIRTQVPFFKTIVHVVKYGLERTAVFPGGIPMPIGLALPSFWDNIAKGGAASDLALSKLAIGTAVSWGVWQVAQAGYITGSGPQDPRMKREWRALGFQEFSFINPDGKAGTSFRRTDPFALMLGMSASIMDVWGYATDEERDGLAMAMVAAGYHNLESRTFMQSFAQLMDGLSGLREGDTSALERHMVRTLTSPLVPSGIAWLGRGFDEEERVFKDTRSEKRALGRRKRGPGEEMINKDLLELAAFVERAVNMIKARAPGLGKDLPNAKDFYNEIIKGPRGMIFDILPLYTRELKFDMQALEKMDIHPTRWTGTTTRQIGGNWFKFLKAVGTPGEFIRLGWAPGMHPARILGVPLTPLEYSEYNTLINTLRPENGFFMPDADQPGEAINVEGLIMKEGLMELMQSDVYFDAPDDPDAKNSKPSMISRLVRKYRHGFDDNPDIGLGGADLQLFEFGSDNSLRDRLIKARMAIVTPEQADRQRGLLK